MTKVKIALTIIMLLIALHVGSNAIRAIKTIVDTRVSTINNVLK